MLSFKLANGGGQFKKMFMDCFYKENKLKINVFYLWGIDRDPKKKIYQSIKSYKG